MSQPALLRLAKVSKRYGTVQANKEIDLEVHSGSIHAVLGENGAGKSTLMKLIYGVEQPDAGHIYWNGQEVHLARPSDAQALGIGMVFQHFSLFETLSVVQNVSLMIPGMMYVVPQFAIINRLGWMNTYKAMIVPHAGYMFSGPIAATGSTVASSHSSSGPGLVGLSGTATAPSPITARYEMTK